MFRSSALLAVAAVLALSATACSGIRVVHKTKDGGTVALQGTPDGAREKADQYMRTQCPAGYDIVEEGEAVVGQQTRSSMTHARSGNWSTGTAVSQDVREWRITYKCKGEATATARSFLVQF